MKLFLLAIISLHFCASCLAQAQPLTFEVAQNDSIIPIEPAWDTFEYLALNDTIDYHGRGISKEFGMGMEKHYDTLGRLIKQINLNNSDTSMVQMWEYANDEIKCTLVLAYPYIETRVQSVYIVSPNPRNADNTIHKEHQQRSRSYFVNGRWEVGYSSEYDSSGKLVSQFENANIMPNSYCKGILITNYRYDSLGKCIGVTSRDDTGLVISNFRCTYNDLGEILVWDGRGLLFGGGSYDSLIYDSLGNLIYAFHSAKYEKSREFWYEFDSYNKISKCEMKLGGILHMSYACTREKGLLLSATKTIYWPDQYTYKIYERRFEFHQQ